MLSLNAEDIDNSIIVMDPEEIEVMERKNRLIKIAKLRQMKMTVENNLFKAAAAQMKKRQSTMITEDREIME
jgi:hypothetical protein